MTQPQRLRNANHRRVRAPKFNNSLHPTHPVPRAAKGGSCRRAILYPLVARVGRFRGFGPRSRQLSSVKKMSTAKKLGNKRLMGSV